MEEKQNDLLQLLGNSIDYISELNSGDEKMENADGKSIEKYFNIKMINLLKPQNYYNNVKIVLPDFLEELRQYIFGKTFSNDKFDKKIARKILSQMNEYFKDETAIEIDEFYANVDGEKLQNFFKLINNYSFPKIEEINPNKKYTIIVESTYCLIKNILSACIFVSGMLLTYSASFTHFPLSGAYIIFPFPIHTPTSVITPFPILSKNNKSPSSGVSTIFPPSLCSFKVSGILIPDEERQ